MKRPDGFNILEPLAIRDIKHNFVIDSGETNIRMLRLHLNPTENRMYVLFTFFTKPIKSFPQLHSPCSQVGQQISSLK